MTNVAIIGLGAMGSRMAMRLLQAGHAVTVSSRQRSRAQVLEAAGATWGGSPREAAARAEVVLAMVTDDEASRQVWLHEAHGALHGLRPGAIAVEQSTLSPAWVEALESEATRHGAAFVAAPVIGSRPQAEAGQLVVLAGGPATAVAAIDPVVRAMAAAVHPLPSPAVAMRLKLAVNALFAAQVAAWAEVLGMLARAGVTAEAAAELLLGTPVASPALRGAVLAIVAQRFEPQFPIALVHKDLQCFVDAARSVEAQVPTVTAVRDAYAHALAAGHGDANITAIARTVG